jgi:M6 family metalloprotease-like protein
METKNMRPPVKVIAGLAIMLTLCTVDTARGGAVSPIGTNQRTLVVCVRFTNALTTRMPNCGDWATLLNAETNGFYNQATFGQTSFQFETISGAGAPANGWLDLAYDNTGYDFYRTGQDAISLADPFVDFANYNRVLVITSWPDFGGQGGGPWWWAVGEGAEATVTPAVGGAPVPSRLMTLANTNEWLAHSYGNPFDEAASVMAHELGHQLGAPTHYGGILVGGVGRDTITPWDIMGLSPSLNHFLGYPKTNRGWIPSGPRIVTVGPPTTLALDQTVTLRPLEQSTSSPQAIRIPFAAAGPFIGYMVENRRQINGDERLPSQGVLLSAVDESANSALRAFVMEDPSEPLNLDQAPLEVGETFGDATRNLSVTVQSQSGDNYDVRVQYGPATTTFDPALTPWGAPPWETPDIWIDSQRNMYDTYLYTDAGGNPIGNGDDAWVDHDNRVYVRVHNYGTGVATNVRAQVYVNSPPGMGDAGPDWAYIGTILLPSIAAGGEARGFVIWKPSVGAHTCVKAVIVDAPGELLTSNNLAQENVTHFDTSPGSPYDGVHLDTTVYNPFDAELPVRIHVRDVPYGWAVVTDPPQMRVPPRGRHPVHVAVYPSGLPAHGADGVPTPTGGTGRNDCAAPVKWDPRQLKEALQIGFTGKPKVEAQVPYYDTFIPIGGVEVWTRLVQRTELTCRVAGQREPERREPFPSPTNAGLMPRPGEEKRPPIQSAKGPRLDPTAIYGLAPLVLRPEAEPHVAPGAVSIEGQLTPAIGAAVIAVEVTQGGKRRLVYAKTDADGRYKVGLERMQGRAVAQAFFAGDRERGQAQSGFCAFVAAGKVPGKAR